MVLSWNKFKPGQIIVLINNDSRRKGERWLCEVIDGHKSCFSVQFNPYWYNGGLYAGNGFC